MILVISYYDYFNAYLSVAKELNKDLGLAQVFLFGQKRSDIDVALISGPKTLPVQYLTFNPLYPPVAYLDIAYGTDRYLFLVNSANEPVKVKVSGLPNSKIYRQDILNDGKRTKTTGGEFEVEFGALGVKGFKFTK